MNRLAELKKSGQSVWVDFLSRRLMDSGSLDRMIREDGLSGLTSNPTIFEKAVAGSPDYDADLRAHRSDDPAEAFESIAVADLRRAADKFRPVYDNSLREDGFVSLEVSPHLARDAEATIEAARRLWGSVDRPNLMIKIPGTKPGLSAVRACLASGINVNVTLLFSVKRYAEVQEAFFDGLEARARGGGDVSSVASVASFFVSRVDTAVDALLEEKLRRAGQESERAALKALLGRAAIANAKLAYQRFKVAFNGARFKALEPLGAKPQRVLWASTGAKNPAYRDVVYVEELIGPRTVNTMPVETLDAFRDHGRPRPSLEEDLDAARLAVDKLANYQIDLDRVTDELEADGVKKFVESYDKLLAAVDSKRKALV